VADEGLVPSVAKAVFAGVTRLPDGGKGLAGVFDRADTYLNPFEALLARQEVRA